ncbi:MAG: tyrosine-type recombinase/integrase [Rhizobiales bacterium]|nr:tyrosine-type recombinase/integrase [Hyphomicrobiales bacterium]
MLYHENSSNIVHLGSPKGSQKTLSIDLTDRGIKALKPAEKRQIVWANGLKGLGIRVAPTGAKSFVFKYDYEGRDRWLTFGRYPKLKLAQALQLYAAALERVEAGEDPASDNVQANYVRRAAPTVRDLAEDYIEKYAKPRKRTWEEDERIIERDVIPQIGALKIGKVTKRQIIELLDSVVARGAPVQANRVLAVVRRMFNFAVDRDLIAVSPCQRIKPPSPENVKDRYLTLDELKLFWNGLDTAPLARRTKLFLRLLTLTMQRSTEVAGINKKEIDIRGAAWVIPARRSKNKRAHLVPLSPQALSIIEELLETTDEDGYLFPSEGKGHHLTRSAIAHAISRNLEHFGLDKFTPHDLRRTGSTQLAAFKVPRFDREKVLNHTDRTIGAVYDVYEYQDEKRAALALWADIITMVGTGKGLVDADAIRGVLRYQDYFSA